jgi:hypothetical protein
VNAQIDSSKVKGEPGTGYEPPDGKGPFACSNCRYFRPGDQMVYSGPGGRDPQTPNMAEKGQASCGQPTMVQLSRQPKTPDGRVEVDPEGCCEYVDRKGSAKKDAFKAATDARQGLKAPSNGGGAGAPAGGAGPMGSAPPSF